MAKLRGRPATVSQETIDEIVRLYDSGEYGYLLISKKLGISVEVVKYYVRKSRGLGKAKGSYTDR